MAAGKKGCELCGNPARMLCESDQASLCWDCDEKVHAANFLVAKHSRTLLCHVCHSPTPWKAAGPKIGPTVSVCRACADVGEGVRDECDSAESESDGGEYDDDSGCEDYSGEEEEDGENQVVPWSAAACDSPAASSGNVSFSSSKRSRDNPFESEDEEGCCSSQDSDSKIGIGSGESTENDYDNGRRTKSRRMSPAEEAGGGQGLLGTAAIVEKLRRFQQGMVAEEGDTSAMVVGLCKLTRS